MHNLYHCKLIPGPASPRMTKKTSSQFSVSPFLLALNIQKCTQETYTIHFSFALLLKNRFMEVEMKICITVYILTVHYKHITVHLKTLPIHVNQEKRLSVIITSHFAGGNRFYMCLM